MASLRGCFSLAVLLVLCFTLCSSSSSSASAILGMVVPLYVYPTSAALKSEYRPVVNGTNYVPGWVIVNPNSGTGSTCPPNSDWQAALNILTNTLNIGYIHSSYGSGNLTLLFAEIANYVKCWKVSGIFIDEASNDVNLIPYYKQLYQYIKGKDANIDVWINPGTNTPQGFLDVADVIVIFESEYSAWQTYTPDSYVASTSSFRFAAIVNNVPSITVMQQVVDQMDKWNIGWGIVYETGNSYTSGLPTFYVPEVTYLYDKFHPSLSSSTSSARRLRSW